MMECDYPQEEIPTPEPSAHAEEEFGSTILAAHQKKERVHAFKENRGSTNVEHLVNSCVVEYGDWISDDRSIE